MKEINKGITLIALVITIIMLAILAGVAINLILGNDGILGKAKSGTEEHTKAEASEVMNLKISGIQIQSYTEKQQLPDLQYLADRLCEDEEMEYVIKKEENKIASLDKIDVTEVSSIFTKIKKYPYEFEIDRELRLASIDGVEVAQNDKELNKKMEEVEAKIRELNTTIENLKLTDQRLESLINKVEEKNYEFVELASTVATSTDYVEAKLKDNLNNYKYVMVVKKTTVGSYMVSGMLPIDIFKTQSAMGVCSTEGNVLVSYVNETTCELKSSTNNRVTVIFYGIK